MYKPLQLLLFLHGVDVRVVGEGSHCVSSVYVCMCVSSSDFLPPPHLSLPPSLLTPSLCVFPALFFTLGRQWRAPAPPLHRWRILPHPTHSLSHTHTLCIYSALWKSYSDLAILVEQANGVFPRSPPCVVFQANAVDSGEATARLQHWKHRSMVDYCRRTLLWTKLKERYTGESNTI